jgi:hypothetical protein
MNKYDEFTRKIIERYLDNMYHTEDDRAYIVSGWIMENFRLIRKHKYVIKID